MFFLRSLCDYAAIAIENARWVEKDTGTDDHRGPRAISTRRWKPKSTASSRFGYEFSILFIDLDHLETVNDTHGHLVGSKLLEEIGYLIKQQLRLIDFAFRYGGDEFVGALASDREKIRLRSWLSACATPCVPASSASRKV